MALDFVAGCFGGCAGIMVGHPLDTIKVRIQTQDFHNPKYKGTTDCFRSIIKQESFAGLFKGMTSPLAGVALINAIVFGVYGNLRRSMSESLTSHFVAGTVAGIAQSFICSPMELAKSRAQIQKDQLFKSPIHYLFHIRKTEGFGGVFRGLGITILREGWGFGLYFSSYEWLIAREDDQPVSTLRLLAAGGSSGAISWLFTYPLDVIKSRIQVDGITGNRQYKNSIDCFTKSVRSEGYGFLFRGLSPTLLRAFPTNAATWAVVTWIMRTLKSEETPKIQLDSTIEIKIWKDFSTSRKLYYGDYPLVHNFYSKYLSNESS